MFPTINTEDETPLYISSSCYYFLLPPLVCLHPPSLPWVHSAFTSASLPPFNIQPGQQRAWVMKWPLDAWICLLLSVIWLSGGILLIEPHHMAKIQSHLIRTMQFTCWYCILYGRVCVNDDLKGLFLNADVEKSNRKEEERIQSWDSIFSIISFTLPWWLSNLLKGMEKLVGLCHVFAPLAFHCVGGLAYFWLIIGLSTKNWLRTCVQRQGLSFVWLV